jgi:hypothetical protein
MPEFSGIIKRDFNGVHPEIETRKIRDISRWENVCPNGNRIPNHPTVSSVEIGGPLILAFVCRVRQLWPEACALAPIAGLGSLYFGLFPVLFDDL